MKMILARVFTVLVSLTVAESASAAEQLPEEMIVAMASSKSVCGGNTGKACPGDAPVAPPAASLKAPAPPVSVPAPASPTVVVPAPAPRTVLSPVTPAPVPSPAPVPAPAPVTISKPAVPTAPTPITTPTPTPTPTSVLSVTSPAISTAGLVGYWTFNDGTAADNSGNGYNGSLVNNPASVPGQVGKAFNFDGASNYIDTNSSSAVNNQQNVTVSAWVYAISNGYYPAIIGKTPAFAEGWAKYMLYLSGASLHPDFIMGGTQCYASTAIPTNTWTLLTATNDNINAKIYINGSLDKTCPSNPAPSASNDTWKIGSWGSNGFWPGKIDNVRLYNRALSAQEVADLYTAEGSGTATPTTQNPSPTIPATPFTASYLGVTGEDKVGQMNQTTPNGKADFHISVSGLRGTPSKMTITSDTGGVWEKPFNGTNWIIGTQYSGTNGDFWFEQYASNRFHVKVRYADGTTDEADATNKVASTPTAVAPVQVTTPAPDPTPVTTPTPPQVLNQPPVPSSPNGGTIFCVSSGVDETILGYNPPRVIATVSAAPAGSDSNSGLGDGSKTASTCKKSFLAALALMQSGDTLIFRSGEYDIGESYHAFPNGFDWSRPTTFRAYAGERPVFRRYLETSDSRFFFGTEDQVRNSIHWPTYDECLAHSQQTGYGNTAVTNFPNSCWSGGGTDAPYRLYYQAPYGKLAGTVLSLYHHERYLLFDGIDFDARGIVAGITISCNNVCDVTDDSGDDGRHIKFMNLEIRNSVGSCLSQPGLNNNGINADAWFINVKIHHCGTPFDTNIVDGVLARNHHESKYLWAAYSHVGGFHYINSEIYESAGASTDGSGNEFRGNYIHDNSAAGLGLGGGNGDIVIGNVLFNNGGIEAYIHNYGQDIISNNTIIMGPKYTGSDVQAYTAGYSWCFYFDVGAENSVFENNICYGFKYAVANAGVGATGPNTVRNNLWWSPSVGVSFFQDLGGRTLNTSNNIVGQDPRFANPATGDFRLQSGSPAIDKGYPNGLTTDFAGNPRPQGVGIDIGAFEFGN